MTCLQLSILGLGTATSKFINEYTNDLRVGNPRVLWHSMKTVVNVAVL